MKEPLPMQLNCKIMCSALASSQLNNRSMSKLCSKYRNWMAPRPVGSISIMCNDTDFFLLLAHCHENMQCYHDEPMHLQNSYWLSKATEQKTVYMYPYIIILNIFYPDEIPDPTCNILRYWHILRTGLWVPLWYCVTCQKLLFSNWRVLFYI